jgi:hypothetical protein
MNVVLPYPAFPDTLCGLKHALNFMHKRASSAP